MLYVTPKHKTKVGISGNRKYIETETETETENGIFLKHLELPSQKLFDYKDMLYTPITNDISRVRALKAIEASRLFIFTSHRFQMLISSLKYENIVQSIPNPLA